MKMKILAAALCILSGSASAYTGKLDAMGDWQYACDNTGTCRIAGYQTAEAMPGKEEFYPPVSVLLTRAAGADAKVTGQVAIYPEEGKAMPKTLTLVIDGKPHGETGALGAENTEQAGRADLNDAQVEAVIHAMRAGRGEVRFTHGREEWLLSLDGAGAALLGADDFQKRIGKPSSLASPGQNDGEVLAPEAAPVIKQAATLAGDVEIIARKDAAYAPLFALIKAADGEWAKQQSQESEAYECTLFADGTETHRSEEAYDIAVYPVDKDHVLALTVCDSAAYNITLSFALLSADKQKVLDYWQDYVYGDFDFKEAPPYQEGVIRNVAFGRGIGDCGWEGLRVWDGKAFVQSSSVDWGLCRGFTGGAWQLPIIVSDVQKP